MRNILYFAKDADEALALPAKNVRFIHPEGATNVAIYYGGDDNAEGSVNLTVTDGEAYNVIRAIALAMVGGKGLVTVADGVNSAFMHNGITAVASVTVGA